MPQVQIPQVIMDDSHPCGTDEKARAWMSISNSPEERGGLTRSLMCGAATYMVTVAVCLLLLVLAYSIPSNRAKRHVQNDLSAFTELYGTSVFHGREEAVLDWATTAHMLACAVSEGESPLVGALANPHYRFVDKGDENRPIDQMNYLQASLDPTSDVEGMEYARYWHGYLVPLKLELYFMGYFSVIYYNGLALFFLVMVLAALMEKRGVGHYIPCFACGFCLTAPVASALCMQYYSCAYMTLIALIALLVLPEKCVYEHYCIFFMVVGMLTNYVDLLTFPIVTLAYPLLLCIALYRCKQRLLRCVVMGTILWFVGYGSMWFTKWLLSSIVLGRNVFIEALGKIAVRSSSKVSHIYKDLESADSFSYDTMLRVNWERLITSHFSKIMVGFCVGYYCALDIRNWRKLCPTLQTCVSCALLSVLPFAWAFVLKNHCYTHSYLEYRVFSITICSLIFPLAYMLPNSKEIELEQQKGKHISVR